MKPVARNRKIELRFMDVSVKMTGKKNLENKAWSLLSALIQDRMKVFEIMSELQVYDENEPERKNKKQRIKIDSEFLTMYV